MILHGYLASQSKTTATPLEMSVSNTVICTSISKKLRLLPTTPTSPLDVSKCDVGHGIDGMFLEVMVVEVGVHV